MCNSSTSTIIHKEDNNNLNVLTAPPQNHNTDELTIKLKCLKEKSARYNSQIYFLSKCIKQNLVLKGLEITPEPTIGNFDQDHANNWYVNLKQFSVVLMKQIVTYCETKTIPIIGTSILNNSYYLNEKVEYCDKTKQKTQKNINKTKTILK